MFALVAGRVRAARLAGACRNYLLVRLLDAGVTSWPCPAITCWPP